MRKEIWKFLRNTAMRILWSIAVSELITLLTILIATYTGYAEASFEYQIVRSFPIFSVFFILVFSLLFGLYLISVVGQRTPPTFWRQLQKRLRDVNVETRREVANYFKWTSIVVFLILLVVLLLILRETYLGNPSPIGLLIFVSSYFVSFSLLGTARFLMNPRDWTVYYLQIFQRDNDPTDLDKTLMNYNKMLGSSLEPKKLLFTSQLVNEAYKIGTEEERRTLDNRIDMVIESLNAENISEADDRLINLSDFAADLTEQHKKTLGFKLKYPLRIRLAEWSKASLAKVIPQIMLFLVWLAIVIVLASFGLIPITPPI